MFLHTNRRITALIGVICLALLIYCLIEREARRNLAPGSRQSRIVAGQHVDDLVGVALVVA
jgi:transposase